MAFAVIMEHTGDSARHGVAMNGLWWLQCTLFGLCSRWWASWPVVVGQIGCLKMHGELLALDGFSWCRPWWTWSAWWSPAHLALAPALVALRPCGPFGGLGARSHTQLVQPGFWQRMAHWPMASLALSMALPFMAFMVLFLVLLLLAFMDFMALLVCFMSLGSFMAFMLVHFTVRGPKDLQPVSHLRES